jgi:SH3-like domain-containing protein
VLAGSFHQSARALAVVVSPNTALHEADGTHSALISGGYIREGRTVELLKRRGDWLQVRTENGQTGWLSDDLVEAI